MDECFFLNDHFIDEVVGSNKLKGLMVDALLTSESDRLVSHALANSHPESISATAERTG